MNTNRCLEGRALEVHWSYRLLRRIAFTSLAVVFWAWVIAIALSGKI
jgi:hypothetical protein